VGVDVRIDDAARTVLAGVQARRLLEPDNHITIRLPPLISDVSAQVSGKSDRGEIAIGADLLEVRCTESNDVFIGGQKALAGQRLYTSGGFPLERGFYLRRRDGSTEHSGKGVADGVLESALDALNQTSLVTHLTAYLEAAAYRVDACSP
jgi:hypothetical protein